MTVGDPVVAARPIIERLTPLIEAFTAGGHRFALVGGIVRDLALGVDAASADIDVTTDARPEAVKALVAPIASALWAQGERFGTIGATVGDDDLEITTHRAEVYDPDSRKPIVAFGDDLGDDLARRDFTINAMAIDASTATLVDPHGGFADLQARILRTPLSPEVAFDDDPLRMLRAARFLARFDLEPEPALEAAMTAMVDRLAIVSVERVRDEWSKLLALPLPRPGIDLLVRTGLLARIEPAWDDCCLRRPDLVSALDDPAAGPVLRRTLFLGAVEDPAAHAERFRWSNDQRRSSIRALEFATAVAELPAGTMPLDRFVRVWRRRLGVDDLALGLGVARHRGLTEAVAAVAARHDELAAIEELDRPRPPIDGDEVMARYSIRGAEVGEALAVLEDARLERGPLTVEEATAVLDEWSAPRSGRSGVEH